MRINGAADHALISDGFVSRHSSYKMKSRSVSFNARADQISSDLSNRRQKRTSECKALKSMSGCEGPRHQPTERIDRSPLQRIAVHRGRDAVYSTVPFAVQEEPGVSIQGLSISSLLLGNCLQPLLSVTGSTHLPSSNHLLEPIAKYLDTQKILEPSN